MLSPAPRSEAASSSRFTPMNPPRRWACPSCTMENDQNNNACSACGTPRLAVGNLATPHSTRARSNTPAGYSAMSTVGPPSPVPERERSAERPRGHSPSTPGHHVYPGSYAASSSSTPSGAPPMTPMHIDHLTETEKRILALERALLRRTDALAQRLDQLDRSTEQRFLQMKERATTVDQQFTAVREKQTFLENRINGLKDQVTTIQSTPLEKVGEMHYEVLKSRVSTLARTTEVAVHEMIRNHLDAMKGKLGDLMEKEMTGRVERAIQSSTRLLRTGGAKGGETPASTASVSTPASTTPLTTNANEARSRPSPLDMSALHGLGAQSEGSVTSPLLTPTRSGYAKPLDVKVSCFSMSPNGWPREDQWQLQARQRYDHEAAELELLVLHREVQDWLSKQRKFEARLALVEARLTKPVEEQQRVLCC